jgi:superfamily II DNA or RNA helicase
MTFVDELHTIPDGREDIYTEAKNIFGFSATPGKQGPSIFKERLLEYGMEDAIRDGVLAPYSTYLLDDVVSRDDNMLSELPQRLESILERHRYKLKDLDVKKLSDLRGIIYVNNGGSSNVVDSLTAKLNECPHYSARGILSAKGPNTLRKSLKAFKRGDVNVLVADRMLTMGFDAKVDYIAVLKNDVSLDNLIQMRGRSLRKHNDDSKVAALIMTGALFEKLAEDKIRYSQEYRLSKQGLHNAFSSSKENKEWIKAYMGKFYRERRLKIKDVLGSKIKDVLDNFYFIATGRSTVGGFSLADQKPAVISLFYGFADGVIDDHLHRNLTSSRATVMSHQPPSFERAVASHQ